MNTAQVYAWIRSGRRHELPHYVYRCYDADGVLLYVGYSRDVEKRMQSHRQASPLLWRYMTSHTISGPYVGSIAARAVEREAIENEAPLLNVEHQLRHPSLLAADVADYLAKRGAA